MPLRTMTAMRSALLVLWHYHQRTHRGIARYAREHRRHSARFALFDDPVSAERGCNHPG